MTSTFLAACPRPGCVVEFLHGNAFHVAWVLEEQSGRLRLFTVHKRETLLPASRVLPWIGPRFPVAASREEILNTLERCHARREEVRRALDPMELWTMTQGEVDRAGVDWFAELLWENPDPDQTAALGRALLDCKSHFKFQGTEFEVYSEEKAQARSAEMEAARHRESVIVGAQALFKTLWTRRDREGEGLGVDLGVHLDEDVAEGLRALLMKRIAEPEDSESGALWKQAARGLPDDPHLPLHLARIWGVVPAHYNFLLDQADYPAGDDWSHEFAEDIRAVQTRCDAEAREPEDTPFVSVDSATTRDMDDAFYVQQLPSGDFRLSLALARPVAGWEFGGALDAGVAYRVSSLYLPEGNSHMLPESLGLDTFTLREGQPRPALVLDFEVGADGEARFCAPRSAWVRVAANMTYERVEAALAGEPEEQDRSRVEDLEAGVPLAEALRRARVARGAAVIEREEPGIVLQGEGRSVQVELEPKTLYPKAQILVSEFMILANSAVALWAAEEGIPLVHRTQDVSISRELAGVWSAPEDIHRVVKSLGASILELQPRRHAGLGVAAYAPLTSPLRRYTDFINVAQLAHYFEQGSPRWSAERLAAMLPGVAARLDEVGRVQRFRPRYWKLLYIKQQGPERLRRAVVLEEFHAAVTVSLPEEQIIVRGPRELFGDKLYPGQPFQVRLGKVDPLNNEIHILEALEE